LFNNLLEYLETVQNNTDLGDSVDVIYLDFTKVFDKVSHRQLAQVLKAHGIRGKILQWIISWLTDRSKEAFTTVDHQAGNLFGPVFHKGVSWVHYVLLFI